MYLSPDCLLDVLRMSVSDIDDGECDNFVQVLMHNRHLKVCMFVCLYVCGYVCMYVHVCVGSMIVCGDWKCMYTCKILKHVRM